MRNYKDYEAKHPILSSITNNSVFNLEREFAEDDLKMIEYKKKSRKGRNDMGELEEKVSGNEVIMFIVGIVLISLIFSTNFTGFSIVSLSQKNLNYFGLAILLLFIVGFFFYLRKKKRDYRK